MHKISRKSKQKNELFLKWRIWTHTGQVKWKEALDLLPRDLSDSVVYNRADELSTTVMYLITQTNFTHSIVICGSATLR